LASIVWDCHKDRAPIVWGGRAFAQVILAVVWNWMTSPYCVSHTIADRSDHPQESPHDEKVYLRKHREDPHNETIHPVGSPTQ
jgi:hypothetical protein